MNTLHTFLDQHPDLASHAEITEALRDVLSLRTAQSVIQERFWAGFPDLSLLWIYGEFLYLSGCDTHPYPNIQREIFSSMVLEDCATVRTVKQLAQEQWRNFMPDGYPGYIWLHTPNEKETVQGIKQIWQVAVYPQYEQALTHDISNRLSRSEDGTYWDHQYCGWYLRQVPYQVEHHDTTIAEYPDGHLVVKQNWRLLKEDPWIVKVPVHPLDPPRTATITEVFIKPRWNDKPRKVAG